MIIMIDERQHLLKEIHDYEHDIKVQSERIKELESVMREYITMLEENPLRLLDTEGYAYRKFKELLKED